MRRFQRLFREYRIGKKKFLPRGLWALGLLVVTGVLYQQCSDVKLVPRQDQSVLERRVRSTLPPPERRPVRMRLVLFVDQSYSMIQGKCPSDLDGSASRPDNKVEGCKPEPGIDPDLHRYDAINEWLDELAAAPTTKPDDILIALVPFSGGKHKRPRKEENASLYNFRSIADTRVRLEQLRQEQIREMTLMIKESPMTKSPPEATYMGTTAPRSTLEYMYPIINKEMADLEKSELLAFTPFHIVYVSDGVFKPLKDHWDKVWKFSGCDKNSSFQLCYDLRRDFRNEIGDVDENTFDNTVVSFKKFLDLRKNFADSSLDLRFVKIHPDRVSADDMNPGGSSVNFRNLFDEIKQSLEDAATEIKIYSQFDGHRPFSILGGASIKTYKIEKFYLVNLNRYVDDFGRSQVDSDGDGLSDDEEVQLGTAPDNPRTNGVCLDVITSLYGCKQFGCDTKRDDDGDGLNACEEVALSSRNDDIDSDDDGILDSHEALRRLSPLKDERRSFSAPDKESAYTHFLRGVSILADLNKIAKEATIHFSLDEISFVSTLDNFKQPVLVTEYDVLIDNIPMGRSLAINSTPDFVDRVGASRKPELYPLATSHGTDENQVVYVVFVRALQDPEDTYWLLYRENVSLAAAPGAGGEYLLDFKKFVQMEQTEP